MTENQIETIGKIKLDLTHYPGEDLYCDGEIEDELLAIARDCAAVEYQRIIEERKSWEILYHLSPLRENIVEWLPINRAMKVLEVGSGCGAITGALSKKAGEVTCVELSKKRSQINAYRHMDADNVTIHVGNFQDVEPDLPCDYDYICLIGVFEYARGYIGSEKPYEDFLTIIKKHLKPGGHIAIAIENKFGLKYWAGCREDHLGVYFAGIEDYPEGGVVRTFTRDTLLAIAKRCGFSEMQMYYPYPDYKFMTTLYSDRRLPKRGELSDNMRNFDRDRLQLFDEKRVFDSVIGEGQFPLFSNSYLLLLGAPLSEEYVKYSNDRKEAFQIKTVQRSTGFGPVIEKHPLSKEAEKHIEDTVKAYEKLAGRYRGSLLAVNEAKLEKTADGSNYIKIKFLKGKTLEEILDERLEKQDVEGFQNLFDEYVKRISAGEEQEIADYDMIFANIMIEQDDNGCYKLDNTWNLIDCEWTFERVVETKEIAFRAIYCYLLEDEKRNRLNLDLIMNKLGIGQAEAEQYRRQEMKFQKYVTGKRLSTAELREAIGKKIYPLSDICEGLRDRSGSDRIQIYEDTGSGFREEQSFFPEEDGEQLVRNAEGLVELSVKIGRGRSALRIDPGGNPCLVWLKRIAWNGEAVALKGKHLQVNGFRIGEDVYAFPTEDPNITLSLWGLSGEEENRLEMVMEVTKMPMETIKHLQKRGLFG
ncbi:MAG: class I SAM-dependent methyltransferase [Bacteroidales bacterium]|nr:class I SAM-dependent methyltransferase [Bacteroidales bacterium]MCM1416096.1 class I SAM-dependent methyltransferase [bacterium]MCM1423112.1 class I SAM-dependent methyltransferase [bacterium]